LFFVCDILIDYIKSNIKIAHEQKTDPSGTPRALSSIVFICKELLDLIGQTIFSEGEERLLVHCNPGRPDTVSYAAHTTFIKELNGQH
jgi:hypothetical protein